ncbi:MAG: hypothetical protein JWP71_1358 [Mucilaginibacter sp.]|nr:hypothetical protein [Mucilaginibacter sp.]
MLINHVTWPNRLRLNKYLPAFSGCSFVCFVIGFAIKVLLCTLFFTAFVKPPTSCFTLSVNKFLPFYILIPIYKSRILLIIKHIHLTYEYV